MHKRLVRCAAVREDSPVRTPSASVTSSAGIPPVTSSGGIPPVTSSGGIPPVTSSKEESPTMTSEDSPGTPCPNSGHSTPTISLSMESDRIPLGDSLSEQNSPVGDPNRVFDGSRPVVASKGDSSPLGKDLTSRLLVDDSLNMLRRAASHDTVYVENKVALRRTSSLRRDAPLTHETLQRTASSPHETVYLDHKVPLRRTASLEPRTRTDPKVSALRDLFAKPTKCDNPIPSRKVITRKKAVSSLDVPNIGEGLGLDRTVPPVSPTYKDRPARLDITSHVRPNHSGGVLVKQHCIQQGELVKQHCVELGDTNRLAVKSDSFPERTPSGTFIHPEIARVRSLGDVPCNFTGSGSNSPTGGNWNTRSSSNSPTGGNWNSRSTGNSPTGGNWNSSHHGNSSHSNSPAVKRSDSLRAVTVHEEEVPVIVRRRGCTLRVRITSFTDENEDYYETYGGIQPIHVCISFLMY